MLLLIRIASLDAVFYTGHLCSQNLSFYFSVLSPGDSFVTPTLSFCQNGSPHTESFGRSYQCNRTAGEKLHLAKPKLLNHFYHPSSYSLLLRRPSPPLWIGIRVCGRSPHGCSQIVTDDAAHELHVVPDASLRSLHNRPISR